MPGTLDVYLHRDLVGHLTQDAQGELAFIYAQSWLEDPAAIPLSHSLLLRAKPFSRKECRGFFAGVLPEEGTRELVARNLGISPRNDFKMLEEIGGECAGAVTFMPAGAPLPERDDGYRELSAADLAALLNELPRRPLLAGEKDIRLSLAGAQDKMAVHVKDGKISLPLGGAPSTHILKPDNPHFPGLVFNEAFCMRLAASIGLSVAETQVGHAGKTDYLLVARYDRAASPTRIERLHQEDFCQALGVPPEMKYQNEGGPSLKQGFELVRETSDAPVIDLQALLDVVIFNFLIGNHDAHGKNFSLLYGRDPSEQTVRLAPFYDLLSTIFYPDLTKKMAMKIGGEYESERLVPRHFERLATEAGLAKPIVRKRVPEMAQTLLDSLNTTGVSHPTIQALPDLIRKRCEEAQNAFHDHVD